MGLAQCLANVQSSFGCMRLRLTAPRYNTKFFDDSPGCRGLRQAGMRAEATIVTTYVAFDGDKDMWAYGFMKGWSRNHRIDFELLDAHDLDNITSRARDEYYVKGKLRERMNQSRTFVLLVGEATKYLHKYVGWEIDLAIEMGLPIIVVNLNNKTSMDVDFCPAKVRDLCAVHIPFKLAAIRHALGNWPTFYSAGNLKGAWHYPELAQQ